MSKSPKIVKTNVIDRVDMPDDDLKMSDDDLKICEGYEIPSYESSDTTRICLIQTGCWGDCVNSTLMFKPIKDKYPDSTIDVYTSSLYSSAFYNNPYIHKLIQFKAGTKHPALHIMHLIPKVIKSCGYDFIFNPHPMINPDKWESIKNNHLGVNLICAWIRALEDNDIKYKLPLETVLQLTDKEVATVDQFCENIPMNRRNILMETHGESGQTYWDTEWTKKVGEHLLDGNTNIFVSRQHRCEGTEYLQNISEDNVWFAGKLSIRECAELFNKCDAFFSVSSGLSNACNTNWCKNDIIWVESTNSQGCSSFPLRSKGKLFWHDYSIIDFIEMLKKNNI
jgi:hypothetical protein